MNETGRDRRRMPWIARLPACLWAAADRYTTLDLDDEHVARP